MGRPIDDDYSRNQCALMIRIDGDEIYMPLNFNMRADEIRDIYPYLLDMFNNPAPNPALKFQKDDAEGKYKNLTEKERREMLLAVKKLSLLWYNKAEDSLLSIAMRFAVDIKLRGIEELRHMFETVRPLEEIQVDKKLTDEEAERILEETGMSHPTEKEFDPGDEQDIPLGIAGDMSVNLYNTGAPQDYLSDELDAMESKLKVQDEFEKIANGEGDTMERDYSSKYEKGSKLTAAQAAGGIMGMYPEDEGNVLDALDKEDGLDSPEYDDDYKDFRDSAQVEEEDHASETKTVSADDMFDDEGEEGDEATLSFMDYDAEEEAEGGEFLPEDEDGDPFEGMDEDFPDSGDDDE